MAVSTINRAVKVASGKLENLAQYTAYNYYVTVPDLKTKLSIPSNATIISIIVIGWSGLGSSVGVGLSSADALWVFFQSGYTLTSSSYIYVRVSYI